MLIALPHRMTQLSSQPAASGVDRCIAQVDDESLLGPKLTGV